MPGNRTPLRVHVLRSLERKMNAPFTVPTRRSVSELFLVFLWGCFFLEAFFWAWAMTGDLPQAHPRRARPVRGHEGSRTLLGGLFALDLATATFAHAQGTSPITPPVAQASTDVAYPDGAAGDAVV